jgi:hypothetical protein
LSGVLSSLRCPLTCGLITNILRKLLIHDFVALGRTGLA